MKVIDLLNKIANGEDAPKEIIYGGWRWHISFDGYYNHIINEKLTNYILRSEDWKEYLNTEIKIGNVKKNTKNKVEKLTRWFEDDELEDARYNTEVKIVNKINELIDKVNNMEDR